MTARAFGVTTHSKFFLFTFKLKKHLMLKQFKDYPFPADNCVHQLSCKISNDNGKLSKEHSFMIDFDQAGFIYKFVDSQNQIYNCSKLIKEILNKEFKSRYNWNCTVSNRFMLVCITTSDLDLVKQFRSEIVKFLTSETCYNRIRNIVEQSGEYENGKISLHRAEPPKRVHVSDQTDDLREIDDNLCEIDNDIDSHNYTLFAIFIVGGAMLLYFAILCS